MLKKKHRLTWKDINFIFKKQNIIYWKDFSFIYFEQYKNRNYNQYSIQLSTKLSKHAVKRNNIKRIILNYIRLNWYVERTFRWNYYKIFIIFNKKSLDNFKLLLENSNKSEFKNSLLKSYKFSFNNLVKKL